MECYDSYVAVAASVSGGPDKVKLEKLWIAADCGIVVHQDQAVAQVEGGVLNGLINAVRGKVTVKDGRVEQTSFHDFDRQADPRCRWEDSGITFVSPRNQFRGPMPVACPGSAVRCAWSPVRSARPPLWSRQKWNFALYLPSYKLQG